MRIGPNSMFRVTPGSNILLTDLGIADRFAVPFMTGGRGGGGGVCITADAK